MVNKERNIEINLFLLGSSAIAPAAIYFCPPANVFFTTLNKFGFNSGLEAVGESRAYSPRIETILNCSLMMPSRTGKMSIKVGAAMAELGMNGWSV